MLTGKAKDWFWRYHKMVNRIQWDSFCSNLETQVAKDTLEFGINAISNTNKVIKCWNCEEEGHYWDMCLKDRTIFFMDVASKMSINHSV